MNAIDGVQCDEVVGMQETGLNRQSISPHLRVWMVSVTCLLAFPLSSFGQTERPAGQLSAAIEPPDWLFPVNPPGRANSPDNRGAVRVPHSRITFLPSQLADLFSAPDWHPADHPTMPELVAHGRKPRVYACGYCHLPDGSGRPENASVAGLPATYIVQQVADIRKGVRRTAIPSRVPPKLMTELAAVATDSEINAAAEYFSRLQPQFRIRVIETETVPHTHVAGWSLAVDENAPRQPIGQRIIEVPEDVTQFEHRDSRTGFVAYVPVGAVKAGRELVGGGAMDKTIACSSCHGADLKGTGNIPGIAGRSPSYIMRQLFDIQSGLRTGTDVVPMVAVVKGLSIAEMIEISSYLATLH
jgi:cytochrome c553